jgi:hypothetical protein
VLQTLLREIEATRPRRRDDPEARFAAIRALRAFEFFGGRLRRDDVELLERAGAEQSDPLSITRLMPQPDWSWMGFVT